MIKTEKYNKVIYGAGPAGAAAAIKSARQGARTMIVNKYGFFGGAITESLCCLQKTEFDLTGVIGEFLRNVKKSHGGIFYDSSDSIVLNPETVKFTLQQMLSDAGVKPLFYVQQEKVFEENGEVKFIVNGKEGEIEITADTFLDASVSDGKSPLISSKRINAASIIHNFFIKSEGDKTLRSTPEVFDFQKLRDNRYWASIRIEAADEKFAENRIQEILAGMADRLKEENGRIQVLPSRSLILYDKGMDLPGSGRITVLSSGTGIFGTDTILADAALIEKEIE